MAENAQDLTQRWRRNIAAAIEAQKPYWGQWATSFAFAAGEQWLEWDGRVNQLRSIRDLDRRYHGRELFTADRITERRQAQLGELSSEDDRPELLAAQDGDEAEKTTEALNELAEYGWDQEWLADAALLRARGLCVDTGYSAIRCRWNPDEGPAQGMVALGPDGNPVDPSTLADGGTLPDGTLPQFKTQYAGRSEWEVYSSFQIGTPPGIVHENQFPWEFVFKPVPVDEVNDLYGVKLDEDSDIVSTVGLPAAVQAAGGTRRSNRLRDHCWLYLCYDRPSRRYPQGQTLVFGGPNRDLLDAQPGLPYKLGGKPHSGIVYFHWWRLSDRFQSRSFIDGMKDPQRIINRRKTQNVEIVDKSMPKLITREGDWPGEMTGAPMEIVKMSRGAGRPEILQGTGPGEFMYRDIDSLDADLSHASSLSDLRLGDNPANVDTYAQLALLNDNEHGKRQTILNEHRQNIGTLVRFSLADAKKYWPEQKVAQIPGPDDRLKTITMQKSLIPEDVVFKVPSGQPVSRSQGAEVKKIDAIFNAMVQSGFTTTDPVGAANWYKDSLEAGRALPLPKASPTTQQQLARLENLLMRQGEDVQPSYYDQINVHVPEHRAEQDQARAANDMQLFVRLEKHIQEHIVLAQANAARMAAAATPPPPSGGPAPGAAPPPAPAPGPPPPTTG